MKAMAISEVPNKRYFRPDEVAQILQVSVRTVRRWTAREMIEHIHTPGKAIRIPRRALVGLLHSDHMKNQTE